MGPTGCRAQAIRYNGGLRGDSEQDIDGRGGCYASPRLLLSLGYEFERQIEVEKCQQMY